MSTSKKFVEWVEIMERLRGPNRCPWDREQTHDSIAPKLLEETYEVLHAISAQEALKNWEAIKRVEKKEKASRVGFDWTIVDGIEQKIAGKRMNELSAPEWEKFTT